MKSNTKIVLVVILLGILLFVKLYKAIPFGRAAKAPTHDTRSEERSQGAQGEHQSVIDPTSPLIYTRHARCRMDCRHISESDIREVLREGHINEAKSQQNETPCPTYAIENDRNRDGIRLRIVFAKCEHEVKVVTCIDRDDEFACDCK